MAAATVIRNAAGDTVVKRVYMDRFIDTIEWVAAFFVGIVAANIFLQVLLRNLFSYSIPDSYDVGRLMLGILGGLAAATEAVRRPTAKAMRKFTSVNAREFFRTISLKNQI